MDHLLQATSRTFALTIPLLHEPTRREVTVAYLLFRVADTLEDSTRWPRPRKLAELERLARFLEAPHGRHRGSEPEGRGAPQRTGRSGRPAQAARDDAAALARAWTADPPLDHDGYLT